jgi:hypothetical protein
MPRRQSSSRMHWMTCASCGASADAGS